MAKPPLDFKLAKTASNYVNSPAIVNAIISNTGEGKTYASVAAMPIHAKRCGKKIRCAIVRDTHENIKNSTAISIQEAFEGYPELYRFTSGTFPNPGLLELFGYRLSPDVCMQIHFESAPSASDRRHINKAAMLPDYRLSCRQA